MLKNIGFLLHWQCWCVRMLDWEVSYALEKVAPVVARWTVTQGAIPRALQVGMLSYLIAI